MMRMPTERPPVRERRGSLWFSATVPVMPMCGFQHSGSDHLCERQAGHDGEHGRTAFIDQLRRKAEIEGRFQMWLTARLMLLGQLEAARRRAHVR